MNVDITNKEEFLEKDIKRLISIIEDVLNNTVDRSKEYYEVIVPDDFHSEVYATVSKIYCRKRVHPGLQEL